MSETVSKGPSLKDRIYKATTPEEVIALSQEAAGYTNASLGTRSKIKRAVAAKLRALADQKEATK